MPKRLIQAPDRSKGKVKPSEERRDQLNQLASVFSELLAIKADLDNFHAQMTGATELKTMLNSTQGTIRELSQRIDRVSATLTNVEQKQTGLDELRSGLADLQKDIEAIQPARTTELEQKVNNALAKFGIIAERAAEIKQAIENQHDQNTDTALGVQEQDLNMGGHKIVNIEGKGEVATKDYVNESMVRAVAVSGRGAQGGGGIGRYGKPNDGEYAKWKKDRLEGKTIAQVKADLSIPTTVGDMTKAVYDTDADGKIANAQLSTPVTNGDSHDHSGGDGAQIDHGGLAGLSDDDHTQYIKHSLATAENDVLVASGAGAFVKKTLAELKTLLAIAADIATHAALTATHGVAGTIAGIADIATHAALTTGVHGVGAGTVAKTADIAATKIDDLTAGDDNTDLDASTSKHGLVLKATAPAANLLNVVGIANGETVYTNKPMLDATNPAALGSVAPGTAVTAAHRDHVHANPAIDTLAAATDITTLDTSTTAHGLAPKAVAPAAGLINVLGIANAETAITNKALFDSTVPSTQALGDAAATGTATVSARRDHKHAMPAAAAAADLNTGTDTAKPVTSDALAGSSLGIRLVYLKLIDDATAITTGDGKFTFVIPPELNGMNLVSIFAAVTTLSSSGLPTFQVANVTDGVDMLSTKVSIDANEYSSATAATPAVIDTTKDDVVTGDRIRIDKDVAGTGEKGDMICLGFQLP